MANMKKISEVALVEAVGENDTVLAERDGAAVRIPAGQLGGGGSGWDAVIDGEGGRSDFAEGSVTDLTLAQGTVEKLWEMIQNGNMPRVCLHGHYEYGDTWHWYLPVAEVYHTDTYVGFSFRFTEWSNADQTYVPHEFSINIRTADGGLQLNGEN